MGSGPATTASPPGVSAHGADRAASASASTAVAAGPAPTTTTAGPARPNRATASATATGSVPASATPSRSSASLRRSAIPCSTAISADSSPTAACWSPDQFRWSASTARNHPYAVGSPNTLTTPAGRTTTCGPAFRYCRAIAARSRSSGGSGAEPATRRPAGPSTQQRARTNAPTSWSSSASPDRPAAAVTMARCRASTAARSSRPDSARVARSVSAAKEYATGTRSNGRPASAHASVSSAGTTPSSASPAASAAAPARTRAVTNRCARSGWSRRHHASPVSTSSPPRR